MPDLRFVIVLFLLRFGGGFLGCFFRRGIRIFLIPSFFEGFQELVREWVIKVVWDTH